MLTAVLARLLHASRLVDWCFRRFEGVRRELVLALASDRLLASYNDLTYARSESYHPGSAVYRDALHPWEEAALAGHFPEPPARVLIGAAGGGREAAALVKRGFAVVAFEPSPLVKLMAASRRPGAPLEIYEARYDQLPRVRALDGREIDLRDGGPFDAGILGWASFSHLPSDAERVETLRAFTALVDGPVLMSYFGWIRPDIPPTPTGLRRFLLRRVGERRPGSLFSIDVGLYRQLTESEVRAMASAAGAEVLAVDQKSDWPNAIVRRRRAAMVG